MPLNSCLRADRELEGRHLVPEGGHELVERRLEVGAFAVELVHEDRARQVLLHGELPRVLGLHLDAVDGGDHDDHGVRGADRRAHVADEVGGAGRVEHVDLRRPFHSIGATESETEICRRCSSGSWSDTVLPSSTVPIRVIAPDANSIASSSVVLPEPPWPTSKTLRMSFAS